MPLQPIRQGKPAVIREADGCRQTTPVLWVNNLSSTEVTFETQNTVYFSPAGDGCNPGRGGAPGMKRNTPPHIKLALPDGSRLTAVAYSQEDYPSINLYLSRTGHPEELICFVNLTETEAREKTSASACTSRMWMTPCITNHTA